MSKNKPGRYEVQVFDVNARRISADQRDGTYDMLQEAMAAVDDALGDPMCRVGSVLIRDNARITAQSNDPPRDQAEIMVKRSEVTRLREQAKRLEAEADEIERLLYQALLTSRRPDGI